MGICRSGSSMVLFKQSTIFSSLFFSKIGQEIMLSFMYGLERKEAFEDDKNVNFFKLQKMGVLKWKLMLTSLVPCYLYTQVMVAHFWSGK